MNDISDLLHLAEDPLHPVLDQRIFVQDRDRDPAPEYRRQRELVGFLRKYCPRVFVWHIPNETQHANQKLRQQREGAVYGATDLILTWPGGVAFIEMKSGTGNPHPRQVDFLNRLARQDHHVAICRTRDGALRWLRSIGAPVPEIRA